jgi:hypothetical protein
LLQQSDAMTSNVLRRTISAFGACSVVSVVLAIPLASGVSAQALGEKFSEDQRELAELFDAVHIAQARMFEEIAAIDHSARLRAARNDFENSLRRRANMSMAEMMAMMRMHSRMSMPGPFDEAESALRNEMVALLRMRHSSDAILGAYDGSPLPSRAIETIRLGRFFESDVYEIFADDAIKDKAAALSDAVATYLSSELAVAAQPMPASELLDRPYSGAFAHGYPQLSKLLWSTQWLQLATIEAMILQQEAAYYWESIDTVRERFESKLNDGPEGGSPMPVELPMTPAIAPRLFTLSPETAIVLDNLNVFETAVADILSYPNLADKPALLNSLVDDFTDRGANFETTIDYLVSALRGGIYNQGGPAVGELLQSERNRSRMEMGMQHSMIMSTQ